MGRRKQMPSQPRMISFYIWWGADTKEPMGTLLEAASQEDALSQAREVARRSGSKEYGARRMTERQYETMMYRLGLQSCM